MTRREILDAARRCVCGDREQDYGSPESNFQRIADLWNAYWSTNAIRAQDVATMLALLKIAFSPLSDVSTVLLIWKS